MTTPKHQFRKQTRLERRYSVVANHLWTKKLTF